MSTRTPPAVPQSRIKRIAGARLTRWLLLVASTSLAVAGIAWLTTALQEDRYAASSLVSIDDISVIVNAEAAASERRDVAQYVRNQASVLETEDVLDRALRQSQLDVDSSDVTVRAIPSSTRSEIRVQVIADSPRVAADVANAVVRAYRRTRSTAVEELLARVTETQESRRELILERLAELAPANDDPVTAVRADALRDRLLALDTRGDLLAEQAAAFGDGVLVLNEATPTRSALGTRPAVSIAVGAVLGFMLGVAIVLWRYARSRNL